MAEEIMEFNTIQVNREEDGIQAIRLYRPEKRNAISIRMRQELSACLADLATDEGVRAVILTGAGPSFSSGYDLNDFKQPERHEDIVSTSMSYHRDLWHFPKPIIAAVNGFAMGGGFDMALFCDLRICSQRAVFGHPEIKFGAPPLYTPLRWIVGSGLARDLCLTGRHVAADEALRIGLVSEVTPPDGLMERALEIARMIIEAPDDVLAETKAFLVANEDRGFEESFQLEHDAPFIRKFRKGRKGGKKARPTYFPSVSPHT